MAVITMAATDSLISKLKADYPSLRFVPADYFRWAPEDQTIYYAPLGEPRDEATLLHELGHALAGHTDFFHDIELIKMEREAWVKATAIAPTYEVVIEETVAEEALDSYRDWLHARSRCPNCEQAGVQESENTYQCLICYASWRVNDARQCGLRRYRLS